MNYGPTPFRVFYSWFDQVVEDSWKNDGVIDSNAMVALKKLQSLKKNIRLWNSKIKDYWAILKSDIIKKISKIDQKIDPYVAESVDIATRANHC